ncbi:MAG TPA: MFS transporter [Gemmataceae bacterium]|jgi:NNP family nitrate/nitrite transporter-like MFS transporter|nr:MFS transporter [Gemmataceae bacterium]
MSQGVADPPAEVRAPTANPGLQLALATGGFAVCFAVFGSVSAMMPRLREAMDLSPLKVSLAIAVPVILGSLGRIPLGILTDARGGRVVFLWTMAAAIIPTVLLGWVTEYWQLLACGFLVGVGLASFSVGVGFVNGWYPPARQGTALGIYGAGNIGQSIAVFTAPILAGAFGLAWGFWGIALITFVWLVVFWALAQDAPRRGPAKSLADFARPLRERKSWVLSLYYFLTFGGFVAMSIYLPIFLTDMFGLTPGDAGLRTAGFVVVATIGRPTGGWLADRYGGLTVLKWVFPTVAVFAVFMACPMMTTFTVGALGMAAAIGLGNGAVFKLVPEYFPKAVGSVTGLVGAAGGLGGFFPPLVLGGIRQATGSFTFGFILLALFSLGCLVVCRVSARNPAPSP